MDDLIEALQILRKYGNPEYPTNCAHDELFVHIEPEKVSEEDKKRLDTLGFTPSSDCYDSFSSYKFGSA